MHGHTKLTDRLMTLLKRFVRFLGVMALSLGMFLAFTAPAEAKPTNKWDLLAQCESGGKWDTRTGNGYAGGLQFAKSTWKAYGGKGSPHRASRKQQIEVAERVLKAQGWKAWPACSRKLGFR